MATTAIEGTDASWNPIVGGSVISPGCKNCHAMRMAARLERMSAALCRICAKARAPFFFKQWGNFAPWTGAGKPSFSFDDGARMACIGKKAAGRLRDGAIHDARPGPAGSRPRMPRPMTEAACDLFGFAMVDARPKDDDDPTPRAAVGPLLDLEDLTGGVWEPACADGADLHYRGYGRGGVDFLQARAMACLGNDRPATHIIINPPYRLAREFADHGLGLLEPGGKLAFGSPAMSAGPSWAGSDDGSACDRSTRRHRRRAGESGLGSDRPLPRGDPLFCAPSPFTIPVGAWSARIAITGDPRDADLADSDIRPIWRKA